MTASAQLSTANLGHPTGTRSGAGTMAKRVGGVLLAGLFLGSAVAMPAHADGGLLAWPKDVVYVVDQTNSKWPVERAAENLDDKSPLNLVRVKKCPSGSAQCITVRTKKISGATAGTTVYSYRNHVDLVSASIYLDSNEEGASYHNRLAMATHELGHAVGMGHQGISSVMNPYVSSKTRSTPSSADYARLNKAY